MKRLGEGAIGARSFGEEGAWVFQKHTQKQRTKQQSPPFFLGKSKKHLDGPEELLRAGLDRRAPFWVLYGERIRGGEKLETNPRPASSTLKNKKNSTGRTPSTASASTPRPPCPGPGAPELQPSPLPPLPSPPPRHPRPPPPPAAASPRPRGTATPRPPPAPPPPPRLPWAASSSSGARARSKTTPSGTTFGSLGRSRTASC